MAIRAIRTTEPAEEPLTTAEAKIHLGIASAVTYHDDLIDSLIKSHRINFEHDTDTCVISSSFTQSYEEWPSEIELLVRPVTAITSIQYYDTNSTLQTLASSNYWLNNTEVQPEIEWASNAIFPPLEMKHRPGNVIVTYVSGYADADSVPEDIKSNLKLRIQHEWQLKAQTTDNIAKPLERAIESMNRRQERSTYP